MKVRRLLYLFVFVLLGMASLPLVSTGAGAFSASSFSAKQGLSATWTPEASGVTSEAVASDPTNGPLIAVSVT